MTDPVIPAEAVEAAASALYERPHISGVSMADIRTALEAAAPHIKALALDKAADDAEGIGMEEIPLHAIRHRANCYRTQP